MKGKKGFQKGVVTNPNGRPKGARDKKTEQWHLLGEYLINEGAKKYMAYLNELKKKDFAERFERIIEYFRPKQQRTELSGELEIKKAKKIGFDGED